MNTWNHMLVMLRTFHDPLVKEQIKEESDAGKGFMDSVAVIGTKTGINDPSRNSKLCLNKYLLGNDLNSSENRFPSLEW